MIPPILEVRQGRLRKLMVQGHRALNRKSQDSHFSCGLQRPCSLRGHKVTVEFIFQQELWRAKGDAINNYSRKMGVNCDCPRQPSSAGIRGLSGMFSSRKVHGWAFGLARGSEYGLEGQHCRKFPGICCRTNYRCFFLGASKIHASMWLAKLAVCTDLQTPEWRE